MKPFRNLSCRAWIATLLLACAAFSSARAAHIPWILPWNDSLAGTATDLSSYNAPIGTNWVRADTNGHFVVNDQRIRFLGVNFAGDSPFMPTNYADSVAGRLAKFGVNNVRFHHMDASWAFGGGLLSYTSNTSTNVNASQLDRLHYLIARLKAHGVYSDINLLVGRSYRSADGLGSEITGMDWKDSHVLGYFYPPALALQKDYAWKVLAPTNRFTGLPLAKDPAVAFVEIINENGIFQKWYEGGLDTLPARYATNLQARWNEWLFQRYTNDSTLLSAWKAVDQPLGANLIANGAFNNGLTGWNAEQHDAARAGFTRTFDFSNAPSARISVTNPDGTGWHIQFNYPNLSLSSNQVYTISFWAKASPPTNMSLSVMEAHANWQGLGYAEGFTLSTNWQRFTNTFQPLRTDSNARVNFGDMGDKLATFWFADVRLQPGGQLGMPPAGASLATRTIPNIRRSGSGYTGTREARRDWLNFLRDLEYAYYDDMVAYLRGTLGYPGLIFGTIMANSPATVQSRLDVIDSHSYWQHPVFPGTPWDSVNWYVPNVSMVNTIGGDNTLQGLARQRIKGKPFLVTEYQHPSPMYYGGEGPLLLAAYAGLQDWDGFWMFDYGHGNPAVAMGYVRGFFEIGQHPTKMPNLLLAANLFRRGDVRAAINEYTLALTPERELDLLLSAGSWGLFSGGQLGMPGKMALVSRVSTSVGPGATGQAPPPEPAGNVMTSDTGEVTWNVSKPNAGVFRVNSAKTKLLLGYATNQTFSFDGLTVRPGANELGWCTWGMTLRRGEVFTNDCSALIVATGWWENTNQVWKDATKNSVGNQWGSAPVLAEVVPFTLTLPVGTNHVRIWPLDQRGQRRAALPVTGDAQSTTINVGAESGTIWYELEVGLWTASFDLWRARYFSAEELQQPSISGESAAPDGDRVPNLLKYYAGAPGGEPAPPGRLPTGGLLTIDSQPYLSMSYFRDKLATDVTCVAEVSTNLLSWFSGPAYTRVEYVADLGVVERTTIRDLAPATGDQKYMRLRFQRQ